jgi:hypothetical protein
MSRLIRIICCVGLISMLTLGVASARAPFTPIPPTVPRAPGDVVPRAARLLRISWDAHGHHTVVVETVAKVNRIARLVNQLPVEGSGECSQGFELGAPTITFAFLHELKGPVLAKLSGPDSTKFPVAWCIPFGFSVHGHKRVPVEGGGYLIKRAEKILDRRLH